MRDRKQVFRAGQKRHRIQIDRKGDAVGGYSSGSEAWSNLAICRAQIETMNGPGDGEQEIGDALRAINLVTIKIDYQSALADLSANDRITDIRSGEVFNIIKVTDPDFMKRILVIEAERNRPHG